MTDTQEARPPDVHSRLQDLVDENFGYRPTTPIEGLLTILEKELPEALSPALQSTSNGEAGDYTVTCAGCGEEMDERHTWEECHGVVKAERDHLDGAWWGVLGILMDVAPHSSEPEQAARAAVAEVSRLKTELAKRETLLLTMLSRVNRDEIYKHDLVALALDGAVASEGCHTDVGTQVRKRLAALEAEVAGSTGRTLIREV